ncbi:hypothetical protein V5O48_013967, partial [Marasmius crinis-equi]
YSLTIYHPPGTPARTSCVPSLSLHTMMEKLTLSARNTEPPLLPLRCFGIPIRKEVFSFPSLARYSDWARADDDDAGGTPTLDLYGSKLD